jgi:roadblock/LC7 domain-containing protein
MRTIQLSWPKWKAAIRAAVLAVVGLTAIHNAVFVPFFAYRGIATAKTSGLAAMEAQPTWLERSPLGLVEDADISMAYMSSLSATPSEVMLHKGGDPRRVAYTSEFSLIVLSPIETAEKIRGLAERLGGNLLSSRYSGSDNNYADLTVNVPVAALDQAKTEIRRLALRIETENNAAEDVTKDWVDSDARLHNLKASEQQYLHILKLAGSVQDTLEVTGKLSEIRGQIEQLQAEFAALAKRVATVAISVTLRADADVQVLGVRWRPLYRAKLSLREAVDSLGGYSATMFSIILHIPVIALWTFTFFAFAAIGWKLLRWGARMFFGWGAEPKA